MGLILNDSPRIIRLSAFEVYKIRVLALFWGLWVLSKYLLKRLLYRSSAVPCSVLGNPPDCLNATSLGRHAYVKIKGIKLHYVEAGRPKNPLVLLLHGFPDFWITWRHQIPQLANHYRVIALDLKGFGDSDKPERRSNYDIRKVVEELKELILQLGHKRCVLIGHDLGGLIGWYFVHKYPDIVDKFVAISSPHPNLYWQSLSKRVPFDSRWIQFCQLPILPEIEALGNNLSVINSVYGHLDNTIENKSLLTAYKYSFSRKEDWTGAVNYLRMLALWRLAAEEGSIIVPTLLIVGNREPRDFFESVIRSADYAERHTLKVIEHASHYVHHERPAEVNKAITIFLRGAQQADLEKKSSSDGLVTRVLGAAVSTTLSYGNGVFDVVKKANTKGLRAITLGNSS